MIPIQDDYFRRITDMFGLRGHVPHNYEETVSPVVIAASMCQPTNVAQGLLVSGTVWTVPTGECWKPIVMGGQFTQTGGTIALTAVMRLNLKGAGTVARIVLPCYFSSLAGGPALRATNTLNTPMDFYHEFADNVLLNPGTTIEFAVAAGDGTIGIANAPQLMYWKVGEAGLLTPY
jgi:hypothetical protein